MCPPFFQRGCQIIIYLFIVDSAYRGCQIIIYLFIVDSDYRGCQNMICLSNKSIYHISNWKIGKNSVSRNSFVGDDAFSQFLQWQFLCDNDPMCKDPRMKQFWEVNYFKFCVTWVYSNHFILGKHKILNGISPLSKNVFIIFYIDPPMTQTLNHDLFK